MIKTERLTLRRTQMDDVAALHRVFSNAQAMRYWDSLPYTQDQTKHLVAAMVAADPDQSDEFVIAQNGQVIGKAGCWRLGEIGFILHPDHWGQGLAKEALRAVIPHIFATLPIHKLVADVDPRNVGSLKVLAHFGFVETGRERRTFLLGDEWCDSVYLELPRPLTTKDE